MLNLKRSGDYFTRDQLVILIGFAAMTDVPTGEKIPCDTVRGQFEPEANELYIVGDPDEAVRIACNYLIKAGRFSRRDIAEIITPLQLSHSPYTQLREAFYLLGKS